MVVRPAGFARSQYRTLRGRRRIYMMVAAVVALGVLGFAAYSIFTTKHKVKTLTPSSVSLSFGAKQAADVDLVAGAVGQYVAANGTLPEQLLPTANGGLVLCSATCNAVANTVSGLSAYLAPNIRLASYTPGLVVPSQQVMYLVPGAKCRSSGSLGSPNPTPHSMVILYDAITGGTVSPQCLVL